jgi:8-oxo-dGTP pyrophosphatase MutT (NUDIX family)
MTEFLKRLSDCVENYRATVAEPRKHFSLLRWQISEEHPRDDRTCYPGHVTTSAFVVSPDLKQVLLIDHVIIGRWLQPGGHYEAAARFWQSALREAAEETGVPAVLHDWHRGQDVPFCIDCHDVPGKPRLGEPDHVHHDLQYLFVADPALAPVAQQEEVHAAAWHPLAALEDISPVALSRLRAL